MKEIQRDFPPFINYLQSGEFSVLILCYSTLILLQAAQPLSQETEGVPWRDVPRVWCLVFKALLSLGLAFPTSLSLTPCLQG